MKEKPSKTYENIISNKHNQMILLLQSLETTTERPKRNEFSISNQYERIYSGESFLKNISHSTIYGSFLTSIQKCILNTQRVPEEIAIKAEGAVRPLFLAYDPFKLTQNWIDHPR